MFTTLAVAKVYSYTDSIIQMQGPSFWSCQWHAVGSELHSAVLQSIAAMLAWDKVKDSEGTCIVRYC